MIKGFSLKTDIGCDTIYFGFLYENGEMSMALQKITDEQGYIRLKTGYGAFVTLKIEDGTACLLYLYVPESSRHMGIAGALVAAAEREAAAHGAKRMVARFYDGLPEVETLLAVSGYTCSDEAEVYCAPLTRILEKEEKDRPVADDMYGYHFKPLRDMFLADRDALLKPLMHRHMAMHEKELAAFSEDLSGVVFDYDYTVKNVLLCTETEGMITIDLLVNYAPKEPKAVFYGLSTIRKIAGGIVEYPERTKVCAVSVTEVVRKLFERYLPEGEKPEVAGHVKLATKPVSEETGEVEYEICALVPSLDPMDEQIGISPIQRSIEMKWPMHG